MNAAQAILVVLLMISWTIVTAFLTALITCALLLGAEEPFSLDRAKTSSVKNKLMQNRVAGLIRILTCCEREKLISA